MSAPVAVPSTGATKDEESMPPSARQDLYAASYRPMTIFEEWQRAASPEPQLQSHRAGQSCSPRSPATQEQFHSGVYNPPSAAQSEYPGKGKGKGRAIDLPQPTEANIQREDPAITAGHQASSATNPPQQHGDDTGEEAGAFEDLFRCNSFDQVLNRARQLGDEAEVLTYRGPPVTQEEDERNTRYGVSIPSGIRFGDSEGMCGEKYELTDFSVRGRGGGGEMGAAQQQQGMQKPVGVWEKTVGFFRWVFMGFARKKKKKDGAGGGSMV